MCVLFWECPDRSTFKVFRVGVGKGVTCDSLALRLELVFRLRRTDDKIFNRYVVRWQLSSPTQIGTLTYGAWLVWPRCQTVVCKSLVTPHIFKLCLSASHTACAVWLLAKNLLAICTQEYRNHTRSRSVVKGRRIWRTSCQINRGPSRKTLPTWCHNIAWQRQACPQCS